MSEKPTTILYFSLVLALGIFIKCQGQEIQEVCSEAAEAPVFVFDLGGVFFETNFFAVLQKLGISHTLWYLICYRSPKMIKKRFYTTLNRITSTRGNSSNVKDPDGDLMPQLMVDWLRSTRPNKEILNVVTTAISTNRHWFLSNTEQKIMEAMAKSIFDPTQFIESRKFLFDLVPLVFQLKQAGAKLYILSNWDKESFALLKKKYALFFHFFDQNIVCGNCGYVKPEQEIFKLITDQNPHAAICLIDDQPENIEAAQKAGWYSILVQKKSLYWGLSSKIDITSITKNIIDFMYNISTNLPNSIHIPITEKEGNSFVPLWLAIQKGT